MSDAKMNDTTKRAILVRQVLQTMGSDLDKPHDFDFFFYFPRKTFCQAAAARLKRVGFAVSVGRVDSGPNRWQCLAKRSLVPEEQTLTAYIALFEAIASEFRGEYDGWGAPSTTG